MNRLHIVNKIINGSSSRLRESYFSKNYSEIYNEIIQFCSQINDISFIQKVWHWVNNNPSYITCKCGSKTSFNKNWLYGYRKSCSAKCSQLEQNTKDKRKQTTLKKYGVDNIAKLKEIKEKTTKTNLEKWGHKSTFQNIEVRNKWKKTILNKYGVEHYFKTDDFKIKSKKTNLEKWGTEHFVQSISYKNKLDEIGFSDILKISNINKHIEKYLEYGLTFLSIEGRILKLLSIGCNHKFSIHYDSLKRRLENNYKLCTVCNPMNSGQSQEEKNLIEWLVDLGIFFIEKDRNLGFELDIYIPDINLALEFNGLYWHSELYKDKYYHLNKSKVCIDNNIQLIHIWEDDWMYKRNIIKSIILNKLNLSDKRVYARKCKISIIDSKLKNSFLDENHIQGKCISGINIGLFLNEELVSLMCFGKRSINGNLEFELLRFCNKINLSVIGSASKLFKYFIKNWEYNNIYSFADISQFNGNLYKKLNFNYVHRSNPNYWWVVNGIRYHRFNFNKKRLVKEGFDSSKTEVKIMYERGYYRIFGCGQDKYVYKN